MASDCVMQAQGLSFKYKNSKSLVLENVSIEVPEGQFTAIVGPNGCGKTTLFRCLMGEETPAEGVVYYRGQEIRGMRASERARQIAVVHQRNQAVNHFTVRDIVAMGRTPYHRLLSNTHRGDRAAIERALTLVGLEGLEERYCNQLSGGQLQRVWLALALAQEPRLILLDEPTTYLDIRYQLELLDMLQGLIGNEGITCLAILHDLNQVLTYADKTYFLSAGKVFAAGPTATVVNSETLQAVFGVKGHLITCPEGRKVVDIHLR